MATRMAMVTVRTLMLIRIYGDDDRNDNDIDEGNASVILMRVIKSHL